MPRTCAAMPLHNELVQADETYRVNRRNIEAFTTSMRRARLARRRDVVRIPIVVHVLYSAMSQDIPDEQINSQIEILNRDYRMLNADASQVPPPFNPRVADVMIEFGLAVRDPQGRTTSGITRTQTAVQSFAGDTIRELDRNIKFADGGGKDAWPRDQYLNLWVCNLGGNLLGYAQFPGGPAETDGVVILYRAFGNRGAATAPFNLGRTATHEIGHWLNLLHIWGDDNGGCTGSDNVEDTPNQAAPNTGMPQFPHISCNNGPDGDMFMNFMDYTDDAGMFMFSAGQTDRMEAAIAGARSALPTSPALTPVSQTARLILPSYIAMMAAPRTDEFREAGTQPSKVFDGVSWV